DRGHVHPDRQRAQPNNDYGGYLSMKRLALLLTAVASFAGRIEAGDTVYTSTRNVSGIAVASDGSVWASTRGGILQRGPSGVWRKFTRADGLPSTEVLGIAADGGAIRATFPTASARWDGNSWQVESTSVAGPKTETARCVWRGAEWFATAAGLTVVKRGKARPVALPQSKGSHISALLPRGDKLLAAMYGDGLWKFDGTSWTRLDIAVPDRAREITALADQGNTLWLGTRREGVWEFDGKSWRQHLQPDEPYDHDCQAIAVYGGMLYASTLQDGLLVRTKDGWTRVVEPELSSNSPREMVEFGDALYVRHANGEVDRFDGTTWTRDVFADLPRKGVTVIAGDAERLYAALWGGWSEFDGKSWTHHLKHPELQGCVVTALLPDGNTLWVGTQGKGLIEFDRSTDALAVHDERRGLPDDWIKCIVRVGKTVYAGTYCGGLTQWDGSTWNAVGDIGSVEISALCPDGSGGVFIGTRHGLWRRLPDGSLQKMRPGIEVQALRATGAGLWIGCRTEIRFVPAASL
ncbi:MAG: ligand-binding sensor domain-containing protein, partial [Armatimonadota bacterium]